MSYIDKDGLERSMTINENTRNIEKVPIAEYIKQKVMLIKI